MKYLTAEVGMESIPETVLKKIWRKQK